MALWQDKKEDERRDQFREIKILHAAHSDQSTVLSDDLSVSTGGADSSTADNSGSNLVARANFVEGKLFMNKEENICIMPCHF